jgi:hypothetical protein
VRAFARVLVRIAAAALAAVALNGAAQPYAVQVGDQRLILEPPPGFAETGPTGSPRLQELGEQLTSASNRILLFAISDADMRRFTLGDQLDLRRYMIAVTPRGMERERMTENTFRNYVRESSKGLGPAPAGGDLRKLLDAQPSGAVAVLAELRKDPDATSVLQGVRVQGKGFFASSTYQLSSTTLLLLRNKALSLSLYTQYDDPSDAEWIRTTTARWIDELKRLNARQ